MKHWTFSRIMSAVAGILSAITLAYQGLAPVWQLPFANEVVQTGAVIIAFLSAVLFALTGQKISAEKDAGQVAIAEKNQQMRDNGEFTFVQSAPDSKPTQAEVEEAISGTGGLLVDPLSRILPDGDNDNGRGWQCCKYTWFLASGVRMNYASHPDYGPVDGTYLAQYLIDKLGYVKCGKQVGAVFSYINHTGIITKVNADGTVVVSNANIGGNLRVKNNMTTRLEGRSGLMYACRPEDLDSNTNPTPTPESSKPAPNPQPAPSVPNNNAEAAQIVAGVTVIAWGRGFATSNGTGVHTRDFPETEMKVIGVNNGYFALNQYNKGTIGTVSDVTGWWPAGQVRKT